MGKKKNTRGIPLANFNVFVERKEYHFVSVLNAKNTIFVLISTAFTIQAPLFLDNNIAFARICNMIIKHFKIFESVQILY